MKTSVRMVKKENNHKREQQREYQVPKPVTQLKELALDAFARRRGRCSWERPFLHNIYL